MKSSLNLTIALLFYCSLVSAPPAFAVGGSNMLSAITDVASSLRLSSAPDSITVDAHHMNFDYRGGALDFSGNVEVVHAGMTLKATSVRIEFTPGKKRSLKLVSAKGNVRLIRGEERASGGSAIYDPLTGTVVLSQDAVLKSGPNSVSGERVIVYLDERRAVVESSPRRQGKATAETGRRVRVVIEPDEIAPASDDSVGELKAVPPAQLLGRIPVTQFAEEPSQEPNKETIGEPATGEQAAPTHAPENSVKPIWTRPARGNEK